MPKIKKLRQAELPLIVHKQNKTNQARVNQE